MKLKTVFEWLTSWPAIILLVIVTFLTGCATPAPPIAKVVEVPVPVLCKSAIPTAPDLHFSPPYSDVFSATRDLIGDRTQMTAYQNELLTALKACE